MSRMEMNIETYPALMEMDDFQRGVAKVLWCKEKREQSSRGYYFT